MAPLAVWERGMLKGLSSLQKIKVVRRPLMKTQHPGSRTLLSIPILHAVKRDPVQKQTRRHYLFTEACCNLVV